MKPFDIEKAKAGNPVITRGGHQARIICFDRNHQQYQIVSLVSVGDREIINGVTESGRYDNNASEHVYDLFMAPAKRSGWINIYHGVIPNSRCGQHIFDTKEKAIAGSGSLPIETIFIEWEE